MIDPRAEPEIAQTSASRLTIDGRRGFGQVVGMLMVEALVPVARSTGIAMVNGRHLGHTGRIVVGRGRLSGEGGVSGRTVVEGDSRCRRLPSRCAARPYHQWTGR